MKCVLIKTAIQQWKLEDIGTVLHNVHGADVTRRRQLFNIKNKTTTATATTSIVRKRNEAIQSS
jgi:hypothetical protein